MPSHNTAIPHRIDETLISYQATLGVTAPEKRLMCPPAGAGPVRRRLRTLRQMQTAAVIACGRRPRSPPAPRTSSNRNRRLHCQYPVRRRPPPQNSNGRVCCLQAPIPSIAAAPAIRGLPKDGRFFSYAEDYQPAQPTWTRALGSRNAELRALSPDAATLDAALWGVADAATTAALTASPAHIARASSLLQSVFTGGQAMTPAADFGAVIPQTSVDDWQESAAGFKVLNDIALALQPNEVLPLSTAQRDGLTLWATCVPFTLRVVSCLFAEHGAARRPHALGDVHSFSLRSVLCCAVLCCVVLCWFVLVCVVLCWFVLCCVVLVCASATASRSGRRALLSHCGMFPACSLTALVCCCLGWTAWSRRPPAAERGAARLAALAFTPKESGARVCSNYTMWLNTTVALPALDRAVDGVGFHAQKAALSVFLSDDAALEEACDAGGLLVENNIGDAGELVRPLLNLLFAVRLELTAWRAESRTPRTHAATSSVWTLPHHTKPSSGPTAVQLELDQLPGVMPTAGAAFTTLSHATPSSSHTPKSPRSQVTTLSSEPTVVQLDQLPHFHTATLSHCHTLTPPHPHVVTLLS